MANSILARLAFLMTSTLLHAQETDTGDVRADSSAEPRAYTLTTDGPLRDNLPAGGSLRVTEAPEQPRCRSGNTLFDALYALALQETGQNAVSAISDGSYAQGKAIEAEVFQTGEQWNYVWTRDLAYALHLGLAGYDPQRAVNSLRFKASRIKPTIPGGFRRQLMQDTGSGGSYPVSTDRIVWAIGAHETLKHLPSPQREDFLREIYPFLRDTLEQDRRLVYDPRDGLYRGEQSFLDWREQSYPGWTRQDTRLIAQSKALSVNAAYSRVLAIAADYARALDCHEESDEYAAWAKSLGQAINAHFYDETSGLYRTYVLSEYGDVQLPVQRYDLLGTCFAILFGVADEAQAKRALENYPSGPHGPPVIWPQESDQAIYHNQGIWPFVTAYWLKAARQTGNAAALDAGVDSLMQQAAANLSNMENFDFVTGLAEVTEGARTGPVINSRRQLWSVAGYLSMVQSSIFGVDIDTGGIRVTPCITARMRQELFGEATCIELLNVNYLGAQNDIRIHLPSEEDFVSGIATVRKVRLNDSTISPQAYIPRDSLCDANLWEIFLAVPENEPEPDRIRMVDVTDESAIFAPVQPQWSDGVSRQGQLLRLDFNHPRAEAMVFDIYRDGLLCAEGATATSWTDPDSENADTYTYVYHVIARDPINGLTSHPTRGTSWQAQGSIVVIPAADLKASGGKRSGDAYIKDWGHPEDELLAESVTVERDGKYAVRIAFANGSGPINTGITCAVKHLDIVDTVSGQRVASGYVVMPQSGDWSRYDLSNSVRVRLDADRRYTLRLYEDPISRNMSYLQGNESYTALPGGGEDCYNRINVSGIHLLYQGPPRS